MEKKLIRGVDMTAFTDVVFLLLIFFLMHARLERTNEMEVEINLPEVGTTKKKSENKESLVVTITESGQIFVEGKEIPEQDLEINLRQKVEEKNCKQAILEADQISSYGNVMKILDLLKKMGLEAVSLAVKEKSI